MSTSSRNRSIAGRRSARSLMKCVYLKPGVPEDDLLLAAWNSAGRSQNLFRAMLLQGLKRMVERGELPAQIAKNPAVTRHLGALGEMAPVQVITMPSDTPTLRPAPLSQQQAAANPSPAIPAGPLPMRDEGNVKKEAPVERVRLDASLM